jgi:transcriptional regulator GlxA family with amidase domain
MAIHEVALATGFATPMHFARCYRRQFGLAPREERRAHR